MALVSWMCGKKGKHSACHSNGCVCSCKHPGQATKAARVPDKKQSKKRAS